MPTPNIPAIEKKSNWPLITGAIVVVLLIVGVAALVSWPLKKTATNTNSTANQNTNQATHIPTAKAAAFAAYELPQFSVKPAVAAVTIKSDLSNITNLGQFNLSSALKQKIATNGFVVQDQGYSLEFFGSYEQNRYNQIPSFITTDSILHTYHLYFDSLLKKIETDHLAANAKELSTQLLTASEVQYNALKNTDWRYAAMRNMGFFAVGARLIDSSVKIPSEVKDAVEADLAAINKQAGPDDSAVMNIGVTDSNKKPPQEDFSQYIPRGHYTKSETLQKYFKAMMWYGRMTFRFKSDEEVKSAALMTMALQPTANMDKWNAIYEPTSFFVGVSDDVTPLQMVEELKTAYGQLPEVSVLASQAASFAKLKQGLATLAPPQINSIVIAGTSVDPNSDRTEETKGMRFMGQRFTLDASIFQKLICRDVGNKDGTMPCPSQTSESRMLPKGLDITAAMGSKEAADILKSEGEFQYKNYEPQLTKVKTAVAGAETSTWTQNLYWSWLYSLKPLTEIKGAGYPTFMQNQAWQRKDLTSYMGSWTELKHDTILYAKQVYAEMGAGMPEGTWDDRGYVEPEPMLYARLTALAKMTREGLDIRGLISTATKENLEKLETLTRSLMTMSVKQLQNEALTTDEYELIRSYGGQLEHFWQDVNKEDLAKTNQTAFLDNNPAALVTDVATDPNGTVLEEATGYLRPIYVATTIAGKLKIAGGTVWSHYEFTKPMSQRMTDEAWREVLRQGTAVPALPSWTTMYTASNSQ